ncbi:MULTISPECIES: N-acetylglucosamine-6-phosphate deacetylase [unclassified Romboutsia]|uniref:N-acetylglucosamine-6-phosphate deacetylase n=1 Tax=unclassified Romboutsia TaxID=2626894 RepID=UPI00082136AB|nr:MULTISPECIES: N-acetylglucosamine-6-phosphate deacetylase [unclassified Romboutsia]SCI02988.1 N-acetylglucosamine-6-phosphate deacetylase [uncultured Clostridium sp.]
MKAIINGKIITKDKVIEDKILLFDEKIVDFCDEVDKDIEIIDANGLYVSPGLIDIHIHGSNNFDTMDKDDRAVQIIGESIKKTGVTSFLPTTMTMDKDDIYSALDNIRKLMNRKYNGAQVVGAHLEGPFINNKYKGAQNNKYIQSPSFSFIENYTDVIKVISYSPEIDLDFNFTKEVKEKTDIVLSLAHTNATYNEAKSSISHGASNITHLFNAMTPLNHREMGVVGAALTTDVYCEMICDNIHVNPDLYQFVIDNKGKDKLVLVTDSMRAGCMADGKYDLGGQDVFVKDNAARLASGNLAGSVLTLNKGVYNFMKNTDISIYEAINLASLNPAKSINIDDKKGSLEINKDADIALFDEEMNCYMSISQGEIIFNNLNQ